jgi:2-polyprenyl-6-methoxyphenol hydroxylase-like FAD-dependent oxidoreductase
LHTRVIARAPVVWVHLNVETHRLDQQFAAGEMLLVGDAIHFHNSSSGKGTFTVAVIALP